MGSPKNKGRPGFSSATTPLQLSATNNSCIMQGYPYQPWPQPLSFSQNGFLPDVGSGEAQGHAYPTQYNPQMYSSRPYEGQVGADAGGESGLGGMWGTALMISAHNEQGTVLTNGSNRAMSQRRRARGQPAQFPRSNLGR